MLKPNDKQYKSIAKRLAKSFNIKDKDQQTELRQIIIANDYVIEYKDTQYFIYMQRLFAEMHNINKTDKSFKI